MSQSVAGATRLSRGARAQQIVDGAALMVVEQGCLPLSPEALSQRLGISKALVYVYFPTQHALANRLLRDHLAVLAAQVNALLDEPRPGLAELCAEAYFDHVADHGPLLHILLADPFLSGGLDRDVQMLYGQVMRRLANALRVRIGIARSDSLPALHILAAISEEAGALVFKGRLDRGLGRTLALEMTLGGLEGLEEASRPPGST